MLGHPVDGVKGVWPFESSAIYDGYSQAHSIYVCKDFMHNYMNVVRQQLRTHIPTQQNFINRTTKNSVREACARDRIHRHIWVYSNDVKPNWVLSRKQCAAVDAKLKAIVCCPSERIPYDIMGKKEVLKHTIPICLVPFFPRGRCLDTLIFLLWLNISNCGFN